MTTALVLTVLNEAASLPGLLADIARQTRAPDEVVVVDGGSTDGTAQALRAWAAQDPARHRLLERPGAGISAGRNAAIAHTGADVIAVTDGGCRLEPDWLELLLAPLEDPAVEVAMGFYRAEAVTTFERLVSCLNLPDAHEVDPARFLPSARSVAYRRSVHERVGGYPEWLDVGEDMLFDLLLVRLGVRREFVPGAVVHWRLRPDLRTLVRQYYRYARGDGQAGMHGRRHAARFATYAVLVGALATPGRRALALAPAAGLAWWVRPALPRARRRMGDAWPVAVAGVPALTLVMDAAKMAGWTAGTARRLTGRVDRPTSGPQAR